MKTGQPQQEIWVSGLGGCNGSRSPAGPKSAPLGTFPRGVFLTAVHLWLSV